MVQSHLNLNSFCVRRHTHHDTLGVSNGKCETLRDDEADIFSASPRPF